MIWCVGVFAWAEEHYAELLYLLPDHVETYDGVDETGMTIRRRARARVCAIVHVVHAIVCVVLHPLPSCCAFLCFSHSFSHWSSHSGSRTVASPTQSGSRTVASPTQSPTLHH